MTRDFFHPSWSETRIILIDEDVVRDAERSVISCEACNPEAEIPFDYVLDCLTGHSGDMTEYLLEQPAICPRCKALITEKTLVAVLRLSRNSLRPALPDV